VVNNFVSGIILLVERPVKVGDWVVVGEHQGYVSRIKVRATELTTFDRANVFVPNSELISNVVTNMTYADKLGRIIIPVGVAYGSDTRKVQQLLVDVASAHPAILSDPEPTAMFRGFGDSALDFELRCFLEDVESTVAVTSDLCFAIDDSFCAAGIEIPFPQRDVNVRQFPQGAAD
jgi:small-conductance mechanosensitive channel